LGGRQTYAEMALTYVPIAGMMGNWMTPDGYEWACSVLLDLGVLVEEQATIAAVASNR
jgi:hypothetical protein